MLTKEQIETKQLVENISVDLMLKSDIMDPEVEFIIKKGQKIIFGMKDNAFAVVKNYVGEVIGDKRILHEIKSYDDLDEDESEMNCRLEKVLLCYLNEGFKILDIRVMFHFDMWDFFDEFIYALPYFEDGMPAYLGYCRDHGITQRLISSNALIATSDYFSDFPPCDEKNGVTYSHIIKQRIDDKEICISYIGPLSTTKEFHVLFKIDNLLSDIKAFSSLKEASKMYMELYDSMVECAQQMAEHTISYMKDYIEEELNDNPLRSND